MDSINSLTINLNQNNESPLPHTTPTMPTATTVITYGRNFQKPELGTATRLIELVKLYPELYDKTHPLYCNNVHKGVLWHRIADELGGTSAKKSREQFSYIRKRFKNEYEAQKKGTQSRGLVPEPDAKNYRQPLFLYEQLAFLEEIFEKEDLQENDKSVMKEPRLKVETASLKSLMGITNIASAENFVNNVSLPVIENSSTKGVTPRKRPRTESPISQSSTCNETSPSSQSLPSASSTTTNPFDSTLFAAFMNSQLQSPPISMPMEADEECTIFGRQVAMDLQRLNVHSRVKVRQRITKILLEHYLKQCENQGN